MNILNPDIQKYMPEILEATIEVYGQRNEKIIREKEKKLIHAMYISPHQVLFYYEFLKACKINEITIKFLKKIGVLNPDYCLRKSYQNLPYKIVKLTNKYLDDNLGRLTFKSGNQIYGLKAFNDYSYNENSSEKKHQIKEQITYLNGLLISKNYQITPENYDDFKKTEDYQKLSKKIEKYLSVFNTLEKDLEDYLKSINYLEKYANNEIDKLNKIYKLKLLYTYERIIELFPINIRKKLAEKFPNIESRVHFLLNFNYNEKSALECFSSENNKILKNPNSSFVERRNIKMERTIFLEEVGADITFSDYKIYDEIIKRPDIEALIPSESLIDFIITVKEDAKALAKREYIINNEHFQQSVNNLLAKTTNPKLLSNFMKSITKKLAEGTLYNAILKESNCSFLVENNKFLKNEKIPVLLLFITEHETAILDYIFIHEFIHSLEFISSLSGEICGFDIIDNSFRNSHNKDFRMYERMNETMTDIIAEKIRKILFKKGIYLTESKKMTDTKLMKNRNSDNLLKILLYPLFERVGDELLDARLRGDIGGFSTLIGLNNFKNLNDAINKVDYLIQKENLKEKLKNKNYEESTVIEYYNQQKRVKSIYQSIDKFLQIQKQNNQKEYKKSLL